MTVVAAERDSRQALPFVLPALLLLAAVILIPAIHVFWLSFQASSFGRAASFVGAANYAKILADPYFWRAFGNTVAVVLVVVHVELALGLAMALLFVTRLPMRKLMIAAVLAPYAVSEVGAVVMWRTLFDPDAGLMTRLLESTGMPALEWAVRPGHGLTLVALLSVWLHLPFTFVILYAARLAIPVELFEAARVDGANAWQTFRRVTLPLLRPGLLAALLFAVIVSLNEFVVSLFISTRLTEILPVAMFTYVVNYTDPSIAALSTLFIVATFGVVWLADRFLDLGGVFLHHR